MARRDLLHKSKLESFKRWCSDNSISVRDGRGDFQVIQVCHPVYGWGVIYDRIDAKEHYTTDKTATNIVSTFLRRTAGA